MTDCTPTPMPRKPVKRSPPLTAEQRRLAEDNYGLVVHMLRELRVSDRDNDDAHEAGCMGLMQSTRHFRPELGFKFSTYACTAIARHIIRAVETNAARRKREQRHRDSVLGRDGHIRYSALDFEASSGHSTSVYNGESNVTRIGDASSGTTKSRRGVSFDWMADAEESAEDAAVRVGRAMAVLDDRQRDMVTLRFWQGWQFKEIGHKYGITKQGAQQAVKSALRLMRDAARENPR